MPRTTIPWNRDFYNEFVRFAMLSKFHADVLEMRIQEKTISEIADKLHCDNITVSRAVEYLRKRYDEVQPYSDILPVRYVSDKEKYMDEH